MYAACACDHLASRSLAQRCVNIRVVQAEVQGGLKQAAAAGAHCAQVGQVQVGGQAIGAELSVGLTSVNHHTVTLQPGLERGNGEAFHSLQRGEAGLTKVTGGVRRQGWLGPRVIEIVQEGMQGRLLMCQPGACDTDDDAEASSCWSCLTRLPVLVLTGCTTPPCCCIWMQAATADLAQCCPGIAT
jgi:hypothetical protein